MLYYSPASFAFQVWQSSGKINIYINNCSNQQEGSKQRRRLCPAAGWEGLIMNDWWWLHAIFFLPASRYWPSQTHSARAPQSQAGELSRQLPFASSAGEAPSFRWWWAAPGAQQGSLHAAAPGPPPRAAWPVGRSHQGKGMAGRLIQKGKGRRRNPLNKSAYD